jgi:N-acetylmuramoyl-L-alanine amidase
MSAPAPFPNRLSKLATWLAVAGAIAALAAPVPAAAASAAGTDLRRVPLVPAGVAARVGSTQRVALPNRGQMIGFDWNGRDDGAVSVRAHGPDGWSEWTELDADPSEAPDGSRGGEGSRRVASTEPFWVGEGVDHVDVRVVRGDLVGLRLDSIRVTHATGSGPAGRAAGAAPAGLAEPNIIPRSAWGARPWASAVPGCGKAPKTALVRYAIVHHTASSNNYTPEGAYDQVLGIQAYHLDVKGWCDIAYNFLVDKYGQIFEGRDGGVERGVIGGHARGFNTGSTGIAMLGNFQPSDGGTSVSAATATALKSLLAWKLRWHGVDPNATLQVTSLCTTDGGYVCRWPYGTVVTLPAVTGHRDVSFTSCPGDSTEPLLPGWRASVGATVASSGPFDSLPGWKPDKNVSHLLALDAYGGLHPAGSATAVTSSAYWPQFAIARDIAGDTGGGYVVDGYGGLHSYGAAPPAAASFYAPGWDIVRGVQADPHAGSGWVLDGWGGLHSFGGAAQLRGGPYWPGWDIARDIVLADAGGGYVLDAWGGLHPFGSAPDVSISGYWPGWDIARAVAMRPGGPGGYVLDAWGGLHPFGGAPEMAVSHYGSSDAARRLVLVSPTGGYVVDTSGSVWPVGDAPPVRTYLPLSAFGLGRGLVAA